MKDSVWNERPLGQLCLLRGGSAFPQKFQDRSALGLPFYKVSDLAAPRSDPAYRLPDEARASLKPTTVPAGATLFAKIGEGLRSERFLRTVEDSAFDNNLMAAVPRHGEVDSRFLTYLLTTLRISDLAVGSALPYLKQTDLVEISCRVPDLATQTAIADVLGALDDKIAANEREIRLLDELTHALTLAALVRGQRQVGLKDFADLTMGSSPTGATLSEDATGVAFHQGVRDFGIRQPTDRIFTSAPVRMARAGDVLISVRAPVGRLNRTATDLCIGRGLAAARSSHCSGATLYNLLRAAPDLWEAHGSDGTVFSSIRRPQLENLPVGVPDELGLLDEQLTVLEARVDVLTAESARLAATRDALLPELMSGRLTIRTLEDSVR